MNERAATHVAQRVGLAAALVAVVAAGWSGDLAAGAQTQPDAFKVNRMLGRGVNLGNALEAPKEGEWGLTLQKEYFGAIRKAGFQSVRVPIRWSAHASTTAPYTIDPVYFERIDWVLDQAAASRLPAVINVHHYEEIQVAPEQHRERLTALWRQIARRYAGRTEQVVFELLNEPNGALTDEKWNAMIPELLRTIRETNPRRAVIVGPGNWNNAERLSRLQLPADDRMLIATFHYYSPFQFTHQGAGWVKGSDAWKGTTWTATPAQIEAVRKDIERAAEWGKREKRPLFLGEFGAYSAADMDSRARWTRAIAREAEKHGIAWAYWEFGSGFGVYDPAQRAWCEPLRNALLVP